MTFGIRGLAGVFAVTALKTDTFVLRASRSESPTYGVTCIVDPCHRNWKNHFLSLYVDLSVFGLI